MLNPLRDADVPSASSPTVRAPLFKSLVNAMNANKRQVVLDLGAASTAMLSMLGRSRTRVEIVDLVHFGGVERLNAAKPGKELERVCQSLLPNRDSTDGFDLVFCWDIPNYLSLPALSALMRAVGQRSKPGALAHALIAYSERHMAEHPAHFMPTADGDLMDRNGDDGVIDSPRFTSEALADNTGSFIIDRARLLSNGMQEYLLRFEN